MRVYFYGTRGKFLEKPCSIPILVRFRHMTIQDVVAESPHTAILDRTDLLPKEYI